MKATGIVRRVDDLGRIVIPKEIRQTLRIKEGDPMELWLDGESIVLKKYDVVCPFADRLNAVVEALKDEDVARAIPEDDKALVRSVVNMLLTKWKDEARK